MSFDVKNNLGSLTYVSYALPEFTRTRLKIANQSLNMILILVVG